MLLDLRNEMEIGATGTGVLATDGMRRHHFWLTSRRTAVIDGTNAALSSDRSPDAMVDQYRGILDASSDRIVGAVGALADRDALPAVFFCAAGKDRTGVLSAVLLGSLDVRDEDIVTDYVLTAERIEPIIRRFAANPHAPAMYRDNPPSNFAPHAETMERVVSHVRDDYGSFADYLVAKGLPESSLAELRGELLETL
jgi:protein tyrosine/serine phosphatase